MTTQSLADYRRKAVAAGCDDPDASAFDLARFAFADANKPLLVEAAALWLGGEIEAERRARARAVESRAFSSWAEDRAERVREASRRNYERRKKEKAAETAEYGHALTPEERSDIATRRLSDAMTAFREGMRLEVTAELLATTFAVDGRQVSWGSATREDHRRRADWLAGHAGATLETAARHEIAISVIDAAGARCLAEIPSDRIAEVQIAA